MGQGGLLDEVWYVEPDDGAARRSGSSQRHVAFGKTPDDAEAWVERSDERNAALVAAGAARQTCVVRACSTSSRAPRWPYPCPGPFAVLTSMHAARRR